ncbi:MAG: zinc-ribbon domain-containing protein [Gallintestinimicrobium sp.]
MVITYGTRTLFKREGAWGHAICKNCGHDAPQTLCRQLDQVTLFFIPIVSLEKQRGILCESCGMIVPLDKANTNAAVRRDKKLPFSELCTIKPVFYDRFFCSS